MAVSGRNALASQRGLYSIVLYVILGFFLVNIKVCYSYSNLVEWDNINISGAAGSRVTLQCTASQQSSRDSVYISKRIDYRTLMPIAKGFTLLDPALGDKYEVMKKPGWQSSTSPIILFTIKLLNTETAGSYVCNETNRRNTDTATVTIQYSSCSKTQYACRDTLTCQAASKVCNGHNDCTDGGDEANCQSGANDAYKKCEFTLCTCDRAAKTAVCYLNTLSSSNFPSDLTTLRLESGGLTSIPAQSFASLTSLINLYIDSNPITSIATNGLAGLRSLQFLKITKTRLASLSSGTFQGIENVRAIVIKDSEISSIAANTFDQLTLLTRLHISNAQVGALPDSLFVKNPVLKKVEMIDAGITGVGDNTFKGLKRMKFLDLTSTNQKKVFKVTQTFLNPLANSAQTIMIRGLAPDTEFYLDTFQKFFKLETLNVYNTGMKTVPTPGTGLDMCETGACYTKCGAFDYLNQPLSVLKTKDNPVVYGFHYDLHKAQEDFFGTDAQAVRVVTIQADTVYTNHDIQMTKRMLVITRNFWVKPGQTFATYHSGGSCQYGFVRNTHGKKNLIYIKFGMIEVLAMNVNRLSYCLYVEGIYERITDINPMMPDVNMLQATAQCAQMVGDSTEEITKISMPMLDSVIAFASSPKTTTVPRYSVVLNEALIIRKVFEVRIKENTRLIPFLSVTSYDTILEALQKHGGSYGEHLNYINSHLERIENQKTRIEQLATAARRTLEIAQSENGNAQEALRISKKTLSLLKTKYQEAKGELKTAQEQFKKNMQSHNNMQIARAAFGVVSGIGGIFFGAKDEDPAAMFENAGSLVENLMNLFDLSQGITDMAATCDDMVKALEEQGTLSTESKDMSTYLEALDANVDLEIALPEWRGMVDMVELTINTEDLREIRGNADFQEAVLKVANYGDAITRELINQASILSDVFRKKMRQQLAGDFNTQVTAEKDKLNSAYKEVYKLKWLLKAQAFQVKMLLVEHLFEYCNAKFYFQFTDCADDVQPLVEDSLGTLVEKISLARKNKVSDMVNIAGTSNFTENIIVTDKSSCQTITDCPIANLKRDWFSVIRVERSMDDFRTKERIRISEILVLLKGATRSNGITININTVGSFTDYWNRKVYRFASINFERTYKYIPTANGQGTAGVSLNADDVNQELFICTSPITEWVLYVDPIRNNGVNLNSISQIEVTFKGSAKNL